jgi:hypothetical protein
MHARDSNRLTKRGCPSSQDRTGPLAATSPVGWLFHAVRRGCGGRRAGFRGTGSTWFAPGFASSERLLEVRQDIRIQSDSPRVPRPRLHDIAVLCRPI